MSSGIVTNGYGSLQADWSGEWRKTTVPVALAVHFPNIRNPLNLLSQNLRKTESALATRISPRHSAHTSCRLRYESVEVSLSAGIRRSAMIGAPPPHRSTSFHSQFHS